MKQITVKECGECPNCELVAGSDYCKAIGKFVSLEGIDKDCPLQDVPTREEARDIFAKTFVDALPIRLRYQTSSIELKEAERQVDRIFSEALDKLGFKEAKEGK